MRRRPARWCIAAAAVVIAFGACTRPASPDSQAKSTTPPQPEHPAPAPEAQKRDVLSSADVPPPDTTQSDSCPPLERAYVPPPSLSPPPDSIRLWLEAPTEVRRGEPVPLALKLENFGRRTVWVSLGGSPLRYDFVVTTSAGDTVWRRLHEGTFADIAMHVPLRPCQVDTFAATWDQRTNRGAPVPPGTYTVRGTLAVLPKRRAEPTVLRILP